MMRVDTVGLVETEPETAGRMLADVARLAPTDTRKPIRFPIAEIDRALRYVGQNRHGGPVTIDFADVAQACASAMSSGDDWSTRFDHVVLEGDASESVAALATALTAAGAEQVVIDAPDGTADTASTRTAHIVVSTAADSRRRARREKAIDSDATWVFVSLRAPETGDAATDRSWMSQLWLDRLVRPEANAACWREVIVDANAGVDDVLSAIERALDTPSESVLVDPHGLDRSRGISTFTSTLADAKTREANLLDMDTAERREHVLAMVRAELGTVLGLGEAQSTALAPSRRLDSLGLDSLMSLELFVGLGRTLGLEVQREWFTTMPTLGEIAHVLVDRLTEPTGERS